MAAGRMDAGHDAGHTVADQPSLPGTRLEASHAPAFVALVAPEKGVGVVFARIDQPRKHVANFMT